MQQGSPLYFSLSENDLKDLETHDLPPTLAEVRRAFVYLQRGTPLRCSEAKAGLCRRVLEELELVDAQGRTLKGQKRDPYSSPTLVAGLVEHYKLTTFLKAYRALDDDAFAETVWTLFGEPAS